ncbi:GtrA family protein [Variovorax sp. OV084]|uniref:GtrA family protein n=1 Tax=Variovorax sp. OV084 TaxID=1882777 RepID=UPI0008C5F876|nr:GtrA family protein [Variovorax sp. OV084]SEU03197.1 Putative flippase GtrA (transmembrane translocase of bactoprenol-linked glucose) [Variovorax sp. OV084]
MRQLLRFAVVGVLNTVVGYAVIFACMYLAGLSPVASNIAGYACGLVVSYTLNRTFTFRSAAGKKREIVRFLSIFMAAYLANIGVLMLLIDHAGMHKGWAQLVAGAVYTGLFYVFSKYYVFAESHSQAGGR